MEGDAHIFQSFEQRFHHARPFLTGIGRQCLVKGGMAMSSIQVHGAAIGDRLQGFFVYQDNLS